MNGGNKGTNTGTRAVTGIDKVEIGSGDFWGQGGFLDGMVAEAVIYGVGFSDDEALALSQAVSPLCVRPDDILAYWPLFNAPYLDWVGGYDMSPVNGPTDADGPPIFYPFPEPTYPLGEGDGSVGAVAQMWPRFF